MFIYSIWFIYIYIITWCDSWQMCMIWIIFLCPVWAVFLALGGKTSTRAGHKILLLDCRVIECHSVVSTLSTLSTSNYLNVLWCAMYQCLNVPVLWCLKCFPTATCTWSWTSFKSLASLERSMALPRFAVFDMYAFWAAWRRTCHCKSDRHYLIENSRRILLQQDKRQGSFIRRHNIRWTMQTETIVPNSPMTGWEATLCPCRSLQCNAVQV